MSNTWTRARDGKDQPVEAAWRLRLMRMLSALGLAIVASGAGALGATLMPGSASASSSTSANLLTGDQSTFDTSTGGWVGANTTLSDVSSPTQAGTGALAMTVINAANISGAESGNSTASWTPAVGGDHYTATAYVQGASVARSADGVLIFYDASGNQLASAWGQAVSDTPGTWTHLPPAVGLAPANAAYVTFAVIVYGAAANEVHYLDTASLTATSLSVPAVDGPLQTSGNQIVQANGAPVVFRGINRDGTEHSATSFPTDAEIAQARAWGANFIRVHLNESLWLNTCPPGSPSNVASYPSSVDSEVNSITSRGMVAMLSLTFNVVQTCGTASARNMADAKYSPAFWSQVASRYQNNPLVAFDLYNEPHSIPDSVWLNGGTTTDYYSGITYKAEGMQQLYNTVRRQGSSNLVFVSGNNWANNPASVPVSGTNIVNAVHDYTCPNAPPPNCSNPNPYDPSPILNNWTTVGQVSPVMVTESGWPNKNDGIYNSNLIADSEARGWGWSIFAWDGGTSGLFDLLGSNGATYEPSPSGMPVLQGLERN